MRQKKTQAARGKPLHVVPSPALLSRIMAICERPGPPPVAAAVALGVPRSREDRSPSPQDASPPRLLKSARVGDHDHDMAAGTSQDATQTNADQLQLEQPNQQSSQLALVPFERDASEGPGASLALSPVAAVGLKKREARRLHKLLMEQLDAEEREARAVERGADAPMPPAMQANAPMRQPAPQAQPKGRRFRSTSATVVAAGLLRAPGPAL